MVSSVKNSKYVDDVILELNYPFGDYFIFNGFVVAEIKPNIIYSWDNHGKIVYDAIAELIDADGSNMMFISNRINNYIVNPSDWIHFYKMKFKLKGYAEICYSKTAVNAFLEKLFLETKVTTFSNLDEAVKWAKNESTSFAHF